MFVTLSFSTVAKKTAQSGYGSTKVISSFSWGTQNWCSTRGGVGVVAAPGVSLRCWSTGTTSFKHPIRRERGGGVKCGPTQVINTMSLSLSLQLQSRGYMRPAAPPTFSAASAMLSCSMTPGVFSIRSLWRRLKKKTASLQWSSNLLVAAHWPLWKQTSSAQSCVKMSASQRQRIIWTKP